VGHLVHGERADWMPRLEIILEYGPSRPFDPFDREAQFGESHGKSLSTLLNLQPTQFELNRTHPELALS
jgi:hypothetical protein